ncbi:MAG: MATE family efflux transporter [Fibromonadales bacterium]|nr:MATE family efflux transporter [Fibromonadales bacterium]
MGITMLVQLYTSRVVLNTLGVDDYGIYNVVGGIILMFSFLSQSMTIATQRFLNVEIGKGNEEALKHTFSMSMTLHIGIALFVVILGETIGLWFLNSKLNIPLERMEAANWVYQITIISACISTPIIPYNAAILAREKMSFYAYQSIATVFLKLGVVFLLTLAPFDKLIFYALLILSVTLFANLWVKVYCNRHFAETKYLWIWDKALFKQLLNLSSWYFMGSFIGTVTEHGLKMLQNIFYGVRINAAMGIASNIQMMVFQFSTNITVAFQPQIFQSYAKNDLDTTTNLTFRAAKFSYLFMFAVIIPILLNMDFILRLWLVNVPEWTVIFSKLTLIIILASASCWTFAQPITASGKIKTDILWGNGMGIAKILVAYILMRQGYSPETILYFPIILAFIQTTVRVVLSRRILSFSFRRLWNQVVSKILIVTAISLPLPIAISNYASNLEALIFTTLSFAFMLAPTVYFFGLDSAEKKLAMVAIQKIKPFKKLDA